MTDSSTLDHFLGLLVDRLAVELADRVDQRLEQLAQAKAADGPTALDVKQAAARLGVSDRTMHALVISGQVPSVKVGRRRLIAPSTIQRLLTEGIPTSLRGIRRRAG